MSLTILIRGMLNSIPVLADICFTQQNFGIHTNSTLSVNTPRGVLGGTVAAVSAGLDYTVVPGQDDLMPVGLFVNDAAGAAFENSPAVASGKIAVMKCMASVEVDVYATVESDNTSPVVYIVGDKLYSDEQGFLTTEDIRANTNVIGVVTKIPSITSPTLGLDMRI